jgi:hypothetical protein
MKLKVWAFNQNEPINKNMPCFILIAAPNANEANRIAKQNDVTFAPEIDKYTGQVFYRWEPVEEADGLYDALIANEIQKQKKNIEVEEANGHACSWTIKYTESRNS